jgi:serine/threonine-protein kinase HipA
MKLAVMTGIPTAKVKISSACGMDYLLIESYDRKIKNGKEVRLHQKDFCQALGIVSEIKCEAEDGPILKACFNLIRNTSTRPVIDLQHLLDAVIFNFLIGNNDAHGKNFLSFTMRKEI